MARSDAPDLRRATAQRNGEAILDAAERVLQSGKPAAISAVAAEAGLSRVTVYSHFPDRRQLLEAVVARTVQRVVAAVEPIEPDRGSAVEALQRLVSAAWAELARNFEIRRAAAAELDAGAMRRVHGPAHAVLLAVVERGQSEGSFRTDVPTGWLISSLLALAHAAADDVNAGTLDEGSARAALTVTITDLFVGTGRSHVS